MVSFEPKTFRSTSDDVKSKLHRHFTFPREIWILYKKKICVSETSNIRRNSGNPKKTEFFVFRISKKSI